LLYFPLKIVLHLTLDYCQKNFKREVKIYLTKKLLNYAEKNKELMIKNPDEKTYIINNVVPEFSRQFIGVPVDLFEIFVDISFATFNLYFLVNSFQLFQLVPLLVIFVLVNLIWFSFFYYYFGSLHQANLTKKSECQNLEKSQLKAWLEELKSGSRTKDLNSLNKALDTNSQQITNLNFLLSFYQLPELVISGVSILFLFLYYQIYCGGKGGLS